MLITSKNGTIFSFSLPEKKCNITIKNRNKEKNLRIMYRKRRKDWFWVTTVSTVATSSDHTFNFCCGNVYLLSISPLLLLLLLLLLISFAYFPNVLSSMLSPYPSPTLISEKRTSIIVCTSPFPRWAPPKNEILAGLKIRAWWPRWVTDSELSNRF